MPDPAAAARRPLVLALTGSIGMGKSTTAGFFRAEGVPVWDADAAVHRLYAPGGAAVGPVAALVPAARDRAGGIDRAALRAALRDDPTLLSRIEAAVHPLVAQDRQAFLAAEAARGSPVVLLDIPLLFETGGERIADRIVVVTAPAEVQRARVLARPGMTEESFAAILARQMPDAEKRARAHYVIDTSRGLDAAAEAVRGILATLPKATGDT